MTEPANYDLRCDICPNAQGWELFGPQVEQGLELTGQALAALAGTVEFGGIIEAGVGETRKSEAMQRAEGLLAEESQNRATFETEVTAIRERDCQAAHACRIWALVVAADKYTSDSSAAIAKYSKRPGEK